MARVVDLWHKKDRSRSARYGTGQRWRAVWTEGGKERVQHFDSKSGAEDHLLWVRHNQRSGTYIDADLGRVYVRDLIDDWFSTLVHYKPSTLNTARYDIDASILPYWGDWILADITKADVQRWVTSMGKAPRTVETIHGRFLSFVAWTVSEGRLLKNPAVGVNLPIGAKRKHQFLTVPQVDALAGAIGGGYEGFIWLLSTSGIRVGEACEQRVHDRVIGRRRLHISRAVTFVGSKAVVGPPKNGSARDVPLTLKADGYLDAAAEGKAADDLLFTSERGLQIRPNNFKRRYFDPAVAAVNEAAAKNGGGVTLPSGLWVHDLRHTAASWAVQSGASVKSVQQMLGHKTAAITLDVYAGLFDQDLDNVAARMEHLLEGPRNSESY